MADLKGSILSYLRRNGYNLVRHPVRQFLNQYEFDLVLDVGANKGQYGHELRMQYDYCGRIVSFEPMSSAFSKLKGRSTSDENWEVCNYGLGAVGATEKIHVAGNSSSSSLLEILPRHLDAAPGSATVDAEEIEIRTLDSVYSEFVRSKQTVLLKIDTQGYELEVLRGASNALRSIKGIQIELNFSELYRGAALAEEVMGYLRNLGFEPYWFIHGFRNPQTQQLLQMDGLFVRRI